MSSLCKLVDGLHNQWHTSGVSIEWEGFFVTNPEADHSNSLRLLVVSWRIRVPVYVKPITTVSLEGVQHKFDVFMYDGVHQWFLLYELYLTTWWYGEASQHEIPSVCWWHSSVSRVVPPGCSSTSPNWMNIKQNFNSFSMTTLAVPNYPLALSLALSSLPRSIMPRIWVCYLTPAFLSSHM